MIKLFSWKWLSAVGVMAAIFLISSLPSDELPIFGWADLIVKKGGHMLGYGLLAVSWWRGFTWRDDKRWVAWALTVLYACTDEFHQSYVSGRHPSIWDVLIYDNIGAMISLLLADKYINRADR